jgi:hypothetical protein
MNLEHKIVSRRKLTMLISAGLAAIAVAIGGYAIGNASASNGMSGSANAAKVIPFQSGQPGPSKVVGQVPADFSPGTGTIITGTAANEAKAAALAAYPGGTVNRVVLLSDGALYRIYLERLPKKWFVEAVYD